MQQRFSELGGRIDISSNCTGTIIRGALPAQKLVPQSLRVEGNDAKGYQDVSNRDQDSCGIGSSSHSSNRILDEKSHTLTDSSRPTVF